MRCTNSLLIRYSQAEREIPMPFTLVRFLFTALMVVALSASQALACTFHQTAIGSLFEVTYPGSLKVAAATAQARSDGRLSKARLERGFLGFMRVSDSLTDLGDRFDSVSEAAMVDFSVVLAGQQLWTEYRVKETADVTAYRVQVHAAAPQDERPVVVTSYDVVVALLSGMLTTEEATDAGLLQIRGDGSGRVATMLREALRVEQAARQ